MVTIVTIGFAIINFQFNVHYGVWVHLVTPEKKKGVLNLLERS